MSLDYLPQSCSKIGIETIENLSDQLAASESDVIIQ